VNLDNVHPKIYLAISKVAEIYEDVDTELVITSVRDSKHSKNSLHQYGKAFDVRVWNLPKHVNHIELTKTIANELGIEFDVVYEINHIHIEYDPK
jgi:hypothetical protein